MNLELLRTETVTASYNRRSTCLHLIVLGDLKSTTTPAQHRDVFFILAHNQVVALDVHAVELDLRAATMIDSLGLNLVIAVLKWSRQRNAKLSILVEKRGVYATMLAVGLERQLDLVYREPAV